MGKFWKLTVLILGLDFPSTLKRDAVPFNPATRATALRRSGLVSKSVCLLQSFWNFLHSGKILSFLTLGSLGPTPVEGYLLGQGRSSLNFNRKIKDFFWLIFALCSQKLRVIELGIKKVRKLR